MRTVTAYEAKTSYEKLLSWSHNEKSQQPTNNLGEWIYHRPGEYYNYNLMTKSPKEMVYYDSLTDNVKQLSWQTPTAFVCCPKFFFNNPIGAYYNNLIVDNVFSKNKYSKSYVGDIAHIEAKKEIIVLSKIIEIDGTKAVKPYGLTRITNDNNYFTHESLSTFFTEQGALKQFTLAQGKEWSGGDSIDDYC